MPSDGFSKVITWSAVKCKQLTAWKQGMKIEEINQRCAVLCCAIQLNILQQCLETRLVRLVRLVRLSSAPQAQSPENHRGRNKYNLQILETQCVYYINTVCKFQKHSLCILETESTYSRNKQNKICRHQKKKCLKSLVTQLQTFKKNIVRIAKRCPLNIALFVNVSNSFD